MRPLTVGARCAFACIALVASVRGVFGASSTGGTVAEPRPDGRIVIADSVVGDVAGASVAALGATVVVGVRGHDAPAPNAGGVAVVRGGRGSTDAPVIGFAGASEGDEAGIAVAISPGWVFAGAPRRGRAGAIFAVRLDDVRGPQFQLTDPACAPAAACGTAIAADGDWVAVGAPNDSPAGVAMAGSVCVHGWDGTGWSLQERIAPSGIPAGARFGSSIAASAGWLAVGAPGDAGGSVRLYARGDPGWTLAYVVRPPAADLAGWFGSSVAISGSRLVVGVPYCDRAAANAGAAIEFELGPHGASLVRVLLPEAPSEGANFGHGVALEGGSVVVGAPGTLRLGQRVGSAEVFLDGGALPAARIVPGEADGLALVGTDVAVSAGLVLVGAPGAEGSRGQVLVLDLTRDCNANGSADAIDVALGQSTDSDADGTLDECQCSADLSDDGVVDGADLGLLLARWGAVPPGSSEDLDDSGFVDGADLGVMLAVWGGCS